MDENMRKLNILQARWIAATATPLRRVDNKIYRSFCQELVMFGSKFGNVDVESFLSKRKGVKAIVD